MMHRKNWLYLIALGSCLIIGLAGGQDWLVGGYVSSFGPYDDLSVTGLKRWLDYPNPTYTWYGMNGSAYYLPYGVYSPYPAAYYPSPGWTPLYGLGWQVYQRDWAKTLEYAQTRSSIRVYPRQTVAYLPAQPAASATAFAPPTAMQTAAPSNKIATPTASTAYYSPEYVGAAPKTPPATAPVTASASSAATATPAPTTGDSTAIIVSEGMRGYQVFLDGVYIGTEGTGGDPLDGKFSFKAVGNRNHSVRVNDGQFDYPKIMFFEPGGTKTINVEPGTAVYV